MAKNNFPVKKIFSKYLTLKKYSPYKNSQKKNIAKKSSLKKISIKKSRRKMSPYKTILFFTKKILREKICFLKNVHKKGQKKIFLVKKKISKKICTI